MNETREKQTLVEEGTEFTGTLKATCKVVVRGTVEGELIAPSVNITPTGAVTGNVKAEKVQSSGVLAGQVDADDIALAGEVRSDTVIRAKSLEVKLATDKGKLEVTFGDCVLDVGDMPGDQPNASDGSRAAADGSGAQDGVHAGKRRGRKGKDGSKDEPAPEGAPAPQ